MKAEDYIKKFKNFRTRGTPKKTRKGDRKYTWKYKPYSAAMKKRLKRFESELKQIKSGKPIFTIGDWKFSIGSAVKAANNYKEIPPNFKPSQGWVYFGINPKTKKDHSTKLLSLFKSLEGKAKRNLVLEELGLDTKGWNQVLILPSKEPSYPYKIRLSSLITFSGQLELKYPEVAMALRQVYFDAASSAAACGASIKISQLSNQKKITKQADIKLLKKYVGPLLTFKTKKLKLKFRPYQLIGIAFWASTGGRAIIADQMGIGKTVQAIGALKLAMEKNMKPFPCLVVVPKSTIGQWEETFEEWIPVINTHVVIGKANPKDFPKKNTVIITTYASMVANQSLFLKCGFKFLIFDESHLLKHMTSIRAKAALSLAIKAKYVVELTGTPMEKSIKELWPQFRILAPKKFPTEMSFMTALEPYDIQNRPSVVTITTALVPDKSLTQRYQINDLEKLLVQVELGDAVFSNILNCFMIRRLKGQVLNLPKKSRTYIKSPLSKEALRLYETYEKEAARWIKKARIQKWLEKVVKSTKQYIRDGLSRKISISKAKLDNKGLLDAASGSIGINGLLAFSELKRKVGMLKTVAVTEWVKNFIRDNPNEPLLVFADQHTVIDKLVSNFSKLKKNNGNKLRVATYTGLITSHIKRDQIKKDFQNGKTDILILNEAGKLGIELTRASYVLFAERFWNPGDEEQAEDRTHRSGQKSPVSVYYIIATKGKRKKNEKGTVDERTHDIIQSKRAVQQRVVGTQKYTTKSTNWGGHRKKAIQALQKDFDALIGKVREPSNADIEKALKLAGV